MASTNFNRAATASAATATHAALIPEKWSKSDFKFGFASNPLLKFMGAGEDSIIQVNKDFTKEQGDTVTWALRALLSDAGQGDDGTYEDNEEAMVFYDDSITIHERGHSVLLAGNMTEQAAYDKLRPKGRKALSEWVGRVQARDMIDALSGLGNQTFAGQITGAAATCDTSSIEIATVNQETLTKSATATRYFGGGQTAAGTIYRVANDAAITSETNCLFGEKVIEYVKRMATKTIDSSGNPINPIRPIYIDGQAHYVMLVDRLQLKALRACTDWKAAAQYAAVRGKDNPLFSGAAGVWDNVIIQECDLLNQDTA